MPVKTACVNGIKNGEPSRETKQTERSSAYNKLAAVAARGTSIKSMDVVIYLGSVLYIYPALNKQQ